MHVLGIDLGTGSTKAAVFDARAALRGVASAATTVDHPAPGAAEGDPSAWLPAVASAVRTAVDAAGAPRIAAIGLSGQMHGLVCSDADGSPLGPALLWADTRATAECARYDELTAPARWALANPVVPGMFGPLLAMALADDDLAGRLAWALSPKDWLRLVLTGEPATEPSDASATLLWDVAADRWSAPALGALGVPRTVLAPVVASHEVAGRLTPRGAELLGLDLATPVAAGAGDTAAAIHGGLLPVGRTQVSVGTGAQIVVPLADPAITAGPVTHRYRRADPGGWYAMAAIQNAGLALEWVRRVLRAQWDELHAALDAAPPGADGVTFHAYLTGERTPLLDPAVRGAWQGLAARHERPVLLRAALEGVAFALRDGMGALEDDGVATGAARLVGGGGRDPRWRHLLAATLGRRLEVQPLAHASVLGAARLAAAAVGEPLAIGRDEPSAVLEVDRDLAAALEPAWRRWRQRRDLLTQRQ